MGLRGSLSLCFLAALAQPAAAQITVPNADDTDGAFSPVANVQVDLSLADTVSFADFQAGMNPNPGEGVYIPEQWAVVFRYSSVNVPSGVTVTFKNHPSRAPVVWLVSGNVAISGTVSLDGAGGTALGLAEPGPGGFRSGRPYLPGADIGSEGFGPGGGSLSGSSSTSGGAGSYGGTGGGLFGPVYGSPQILPLVGGSGGSRWKAAYNGGTCPSAPWEDPGAGGGAILLVCQDNIVVTGQLRANGGAGIVAAGCGQQGYGGSGGAIRVVADSISGTGTLRAVGGSSSGGLGRIRVETNLNSMTDLGAPIASQTIVGTTAQIWPDAMSPTVRVVSIGGVAAPSDPRARTNQPPDVQLANPFPTLVLIEASNMPLDWTINLRTVPLSGLDINTSAAFVSGDATLSIWEAQVQLLDGFSVMQARAIAPNP